MSNYLLLSLTLQSLIKSNDLILNPVPMQNNMYVSFETYSAAACEVNECLMHLRTNGLPFPQRRKLLRFPTHAANIGTEDFRLGLASRFNPNFIWDDCHGHWHFEDFAEYTVYNYITDPTQTRNLVPETGKRAFCLMDSQRTSMWSAVASERSRQGLRRRSRAEYDCNNQGISMGWEDVYGANLDCQFVDITDLDTGNYVLVVTLNPVGSLGEINIGNNRAELFFNILVDGSVTFGREDRGGIVPNRCNVAQPQWLGDGYCDYDQPGYNTEECNWDRGDCCRECCRDGTYRCLDNLSRMRCLDPDCQDIVNSPATPPTRGIPTIPPIVPTLQPTVRITTTTQPTKQPTKKPLRITTLRPSTARPTTTAGRPTEPPFSGCPVPVSTRSWIGDGYCDYGAYNTAACGFDGGDCCPNTCQNGPHYTCGQNGFRECRNPGTV